MHLQDFRALLLVLQKLPLQKPITRRNNAVASGRWHELLLVFRASPYASGRARPKWRVLSLDLPGLSERTTAKYQPFVFERQAERRIAVPLLTVNVALRPRGPLWGAQTL